MKRTAIAVALVAMVALAGCSALTGGQSDESHVSGVNNNADSFDVTLDIDYTLQSGDVVVVRYPAVDNPAEPGEYDVEVSLNDQQTATSTLRIE